jgi:hypothetical protein
MLKLFCDLIHLADSKLCTVDIDEDFENFTELAQTLQKTKAPPFPPPAHIGSHLSDRGGQAGW